MASTTLHSRAAEAERRKKAEAKRAKRQQRRIEKRNKTQCTVSEESNDEFTVQR